MDKDIDLLTQLRNEVASLLFKQDDKLDACRRRAEMLIRNIFGESSKYLTDVQQISFSPSFWVSGMNDNDYIPYWVSGQKELINLIDTMMEERTLFGSKTVPYSNTEGKVIDRGILTKAIFIVHGHDLEMKQSVARVVEKLGLEAIILHEQPNKGRTIIEKFMDYGSVASFAIILLSPDDIVLEKGKDISTGQFRARQNVILELGFFVGKLGRSNVIVIYRETDRFEIPSDLAGVLYVPYDDRGNWQFQLVKELKAAGYDVDANALT
jgi:hypothetical protein